MTAAGRAPIADADGPPDGRPMICAVDIGATKTLVTVHPLPLDGWDAAAPRERFLTRRDGRACADDIVGAARRLVAGTGGRLVAVGCGAPGPLDATTGLIAGAPNLGWHDVPMGPWVVEGLGVPLAIEHDSSVGALGEATMGAGRGADPCIYITLSTGIGMGLIVEGAIVGGAHGVSGEIGHYAVDPAGPRCSCGRRGCREAYAGGAGIAARARDAWPRGRTASGAPAPRAAAGVFRAARNGDPDARRIVGDGVDRLGRVIGGLVAAIDPAVVVIGGSLGLAQRGYVRRAGQRARPLAIRESGRTFRLAFAELGGDSVLAGAAVLAARVVEGTAAHVIG